MCVQRKYWKDLLNDTPFVKAGENSLTQLY
jgi:hypothetical protein